MQRYATPSAIPSEAAPLQNEAAVASHRICSSPATKIAAQIAEANSWGEQSRESDITAQQKAPG